MWWSPTHWVNVILAASVPHHWLMPVSIIAGTWILEDLTTILVGILAADGLIKIGVALIALWIGIITGDYGLYFLGMLAKTHPRIRRFVEHERLLPIRRRLERNLREVVISTRFIPGLRLPTYVACGFFRMPFWEFAQSVVLATLIWTTGLFAVAYLFGQSTSDWLGFWRWPIAIGVSAFFFFMAKRRAKRTAYEDNNERTDPR